MTDEKIAVRKPPIDAQFALHLPKVRGKCQWCGQPCHDDGRIFWHFDCHVEFSIIVFPDAARRAVEKRDHGVCCDCGEDWSERYLLRKSGVLVISGDIGIDWRDEDARAQYHEERRAGFWEYSELVWVSLWHVDHKTPLWKVRHLAPLRRLDFFKLGNLITRCHVCHKRKTKAEAAERAKFDRLAPADLVDALPPPSKPDKRPSPKMRSRPFSKVKRPFPKRQKPLKRKKP